MFAYFTIMGDTEESGMQLSAMRVVNECLILTEWEHAHEPVHPPLMVAAGFKVLEPRKYCIPLSKIYDFTINEDDD